MKHLTPQTSQIYSLLIEHQALRSEDIAEKLHISVNTVYRAVKPLLEAGFIIKVGHFPTFFKVQPVSKALNAYLLNSRQEFLQTFFPNGIPTRMNDIAADTMDISFIKNRNELLDKSLRDVRKAKREVNHIISGLKLPTDNILWYRRTHDKGVRIRILIQQLNEANTSILKIWQESGIEIRYYPQLEARIIIVDSQILYMTSYNPKNKNEAVGIRFNYYPIAKLMNEVFEKKWDQGTIIWYNYGEICYP